MRTIIGLMGEARTGKDTIAEWLVRNHGFVQLSFAFALKRASQIIFGLSDAQVFGNEKEAMDKFWGKTPRHLLQFVGTDLFRSHFSEDIWIRSLERQVFSTQDNARIVISDCRFKNEKAAVESWGGQVWRLIRLDGPGATGGIAAHPSEQELLSVPLESYHAVIQRPTGIPGLIAAAENVLKGEENEWVKINGSGTK